MLCFCLNSFSEFVIFHVLSGTHIAQIFISNLTASPCHLLTHTSLYHMPWQTIYSFMCCAGYWRVWYIKTNHHHEILRPSSISQLLWVRASFVIWYSITSSASIMWCPQTLTMVYFFLPSSQYQRSDFNIWHAFIIPICIHYSCHYLSCLFFSLNTSDYLQSILGIQSMISNKKFLLDTIV